jgi:hypothetical protein
MTIAQIRENRISDMRLGRHVNHDSRSIAYPFKAPGAPLTSQRWSTDATPILDQGNLGSCTGNATVGALLCQPLFDRLDSGQQAHLNETLAVKIYEDATKTDPFPGEYPPTDTGSDGLDAAKAAASLGYISGYSHAFSLNDSLVAMTIGPVIIGINWYEGFDTPAADGKIEISGSIRGGHELCLDEIDVEGSSVWLRNSWGETWGVGGRAHMSFDTLGSLLDQQGDVTVFTPLGAPSPTPTPTPTPTPGDPDYVLAHAVGSWVQQERVNPKNEEVRQALLTWLDVKGF